MLGAWDWFPIYVYAYITVHNIYALIKSYISLHEVHPVHACYKTSTGEPCKVRIAFNHLQIVMQVIYNHLFVDQIKLVFQTYCSFL